MLKQTSIFEMCIYNKKKKVFIQLHYEPFTYSQEG